MFYKGLPYRLYCALPLRIRVVVFITQPCKQLHCRQTTWQVASDKRHAVHEHARVSVCVIPAVTLAATEEHTTIGCGVNVCAAVCLIGRLPRLPADGSRGP